MKKKVIKILASIACFACVGAAGVGISQLSGNAVLPVQAYEAVLTDGATMQEWYTYGSTFTLPDATVGGEQTTKKVVTFPSGKTYASSSVILNEEGTYTVVWYATVSGKTVEAQKTFKVTKEVFTADEGASWEYVDHLSMVSDTTSNTGGVKMTLTQDTAVYYHEAIDLTGDKDIPLFQVYPYNQSSLIEGYNGSKVEARSIFFKLTDCYDPSLYITIELILAEGKTSPSVRSGANGQDMYGYQSRSASYVIKNWPETTIDGTRYEAYASKSTYGTCADEYGYTFYYDHEKQQLSIDTYSPSHGRILYLLLNDYDNTDVYETNPFKGFTTGEVYLSVYADDFVDKQAHVEIGSVKGVTGADFKTLIERDKNEKDTKAPTIQVAEALATDNIKIAVNETISIPDATAFDLNLPVGTVAEKAVYYAYDPNKAKNIRIGLQNGCLTPTKAGTYSIVYTATDSYGNVGTKVVALECANADGDKAVSLSVTDAATAKAGTYLTVPKCNVGGLYADERGLKVFVQFEDGEKEEISAGEELLLTHVGVYTITYEYTTPFKTYTTTYQMTTEASDVINFDTPIVPEYLITQARYTLDVVYAYEYTAKEPTAYAAETYMRSDDGDFVAIDYENFQVTASERVQFKYVHGDKEIFSEELPVIDVGFDGALRMDDYFRTDESVISGVAANDGLKFTALVKADSSTITYANPILLSSFSMEFTALADVAAVADDPETEEDETVLPIDYGTFSAISVTLVDYYDRTNSVTVRYLNKGNVAWISVDGAEATSLKRAFHGLKMGLSYDKNKIAFMDNGVSYAWTSTFTSEKVLLRITLEGMTKDACLNIRKLNSQTLSDRDNDNGKPLISVSNVQGGIHNIGEVIDLNVATVSDNFAPYLKSELSLSVRCPDGGWAKSLDGVTLDGNCPIDRAYQITLATYGVYNVIYRYNDQLGNNQSLSYTIVVNDRVKPVITVEDIAEGDVIEAELGEVVKVADYGCMDDQTAEEALISYVTVFAPTLNVETLEDGKFAATKVGDYTIMYSCYDEAGNYSTVTYIVRVSK